MTLVNLETGYEISRETMKLLEGRNTSKDAHQPLKLLTWINETSRPWCNKSVCVQYADLTRSAHDHSTFLINDVTTQMQKSIATIDLPDVLMIEPSHLAQLSQKGVSLPLQ